jgi:hypothetical protein
LDDLASGFMVNHVSGREARDFLASVARAANLAILPVGCPVAVPREEMIRYPPKSSGNAAVIVDDGDLLRLIESA